MIKLLVFTLFCFFVSAKQLLVETKDIPNVTSETAMRLLKAAKAKSKELGVKMNIAVVDTGANLVGFLRMDGAWLGSVDIAIKKAKTATFFQMNTEDIGALSKPGGSLFNIEHSNNGLITFPGGIPLRSSSGQMIGGIGVSGSSVENDKIVAEAAGKIVESGQDYAEVLLY